MHTISLMLTGLFLVGAAPLPEFNKPAPEWTLDLNKMKTPQGPIAGKLFGTDFKLTTVEFQKTGALLLKDGSSVVFIFLPVKAGKDLDGKSFELSSERAPGQQRPAIHVHVSRPMAKAQAFSDGYAMKLEFGKEKDGLLPGKLFFSLPDETKSFLAGSFTLELK